MKHRLTIQLIIAAATIFGMPCIANAADEQKADLVQILRQSGNQREAIAVDKLITLKLSPFWWQYFLNRDTKAYQFVGNMAGSLMTFGHNMGGEDIEALDTQQDASSPLVTDAIDALKSKTHLTIEIMEDVKGDYKEKMLENFAMFGAPIGEKYYCKPRGGKLMIVLTLDTTAKALKSQVSKDGNDYHFLVPAYTDVMTGTVEEAPQNRYINYLTECVGNHSSRSCQKDTNGLAITGGAGAPPV